MKYIVMKIKAIILLILICCSIKLEAQVEYVSTGTGAAYVLNLPAVFPLRSGIQITFKANVVCAASPTINVNSIGPISIRKEGGTTPLSAGDIKAGQVVTIVYDGANFQMLSNLGNAPAMGVSGSGTQNQVTKWADPSGTVLGNSSIFDDGNRIGIFNNTPAGDLHIFRNNGPRLILDADGGNVNGTTMLDFTTGGNNGSTSSVGTVSGWQFRSFSSAYNNNVARQNDLQLRFYAGGSFNDVMYFDNSGNIGINTLTPSSKLYIVGSGNTNATSSLRITNSTGNDMLFVNDNGQMGIRTALPSANLHVVGSARITGLVGPGNVVADAAGNLSVSATPPANAWELGGNSVSSLQNLGTNTAFDLPFVTNGIERMRLNATGTELSPANDNTLSLGSYGNSWKDVYADGFLYINGEKWTSLSVNNTLVANRANESFTTGIYNTGVGIFSGNNITTGMRNTLLGMRAGENLTTSSDNTFIGTLAGGLGTSIGNNNTFLGAYSGYGASNSGESNTYIGSSSGANNTTGHHNAFLGTNSGGSNTTGYFNTFIGDGAGQGNATGSLNTFTGYLSGNSNSADNNTFYGYASGRFTNSGNYNVFNGTAAGYSNVGGTANSYFGGSSGYSNDGSYNTFLGYSTGYNATSGDYNTLIGGSAGASPSNLGTFNTYIGYNSNGADWLTNATAIGMNSYVTMSNALVLGGTGGSAVNVGIGTTAPSTQLHVEGNARITGLGGTGGTVIADAAGYLSVATGSIFGSGINNFVARWTPSGSQLGTGVLIDDGANVGIGSNPMARFMISGTSNSPTLASISNSAVSLGTQRYSFSSGDVLDIGFQTTPQYAAWMQSGYNSSAESILLNPLGGMVGIGTNNPTAILHVQGTTRISSLVGPGTVVADVNGNLSIASGSTVTGTGTNNYLARWTPTGTQLGIGTVYDNGVNVGIGTTTPLNALSIHSNGFAKQNIYTFINASNSGGTLALGFARGTEASKSQVLNGDAIGALQFEGFTSGGSFQNGAWIKTVATENWTGVGTGAQMEFMTRNNGSTLNLTRMIIANNGNVGIGASPSSKFHVQDAGSVVARVQSTGGFAKMFLDGTNTSDQAVEFYHSGSFQGSVGYSAATAGLFLYESSQATLSAKGGRVGIGNTNPSFKLHVIGALSGGPVGYFQNTSSGTADGVTIQAGDNASTGSWFLRFVRPDGTSIGTISQNTATSVSYNTTSDKRLKNIIGESHKGLAELMKIKVYDYTYKSDPNRNVQTGFVAQELYEIFPQSVTKPRDENSSAEVNPWMVDYGSMTPLTIKAIQEQQKIIDDLQKKILHLEQKINSLEKK